MQPAALPVTRAGRCRDDTGLDRGCCQKNQNKDFIGYWSNSAFGGFAARNTKAAKCFQNKSLPLYHSRYIHKRVGQSTALPSDIYI